MPQKKQKVKIKKAKIIIKQLDFIPPNWPAIISIDSGSTNSAIVSTKPALGIQIINDTDGKNLIEHLKLLLSKYQYSQILIENFHFYKPRKYAEKTLIVIGYLQALCDFYGIPWKLINKPKKKYCPEEWVKEEHIYDAINLLMSVRGEF
jgi:hypothetical protein